MPTPVGQSQRGAMYTARPRRPQLDSTLARQQQGNAEVSRLREQQRQQQNVSLDRMFGPEVGIDDYIAQFNASLPAAGSNIQRDLQQGLSELAGRRNDAAEVVASLPAAFQGSLATSQQALGAANDVVNQAITADVAPMVTGAVTPLQSNLTQGEAANQRAVPGFNQAIAQAYSDAQSKLQAAGASAQDTANFDRAFRIFSAATEQANLDRQLRENERLRREEKNQAEIEAKRQERLQADALAQEEERFRQRAMDQVAIEAGFEGGQQELEAIRQSAPYRYVTDVLRGEGAFTPVRRGGGSLAGPLADTEIKKKKISTKEIAKRYANQPQLLQALLLDGIITAEDIAEARK